MLLVHRVNHVFERLKRTSVFDTAEKKHSFLDDEIKATKVFFQAQQDVSVVSVYIYFFGRCCLIIDETWEGVRFSIIGIARPTKSKSTVCQGYGLFNFHAIPLTPCHFDICEC